jgi:putative membrane protein
MGHNEVLGTQLAFLNACLNGTAAILLFAGWRAIRGGNRRLHGLLMGGAFVVSALFLISYLTRVAVSGTHYYPGHGFWKATYFTILGTHMVLAICTPPLALRTIWLALQKRFADHRRIVRWTLPIWMYVSVTGVMVYVLLYHPPG